MSVARVTVTHRRLLHVRSDDGREAVARPARRGLSIVCGDFVRCELDPRHGELNVVGVEPRAGGLAAAVVLNKSDRPMEAGIEQELATYGAAGYRCLRISAHQQEPLDALLAWLPQQTAMLVGQSGVGKSSLLRRLVPESEAPIGELIRDDDGRHTTTATRLYQLPGGGEIIDSPGARDLAPAIDRLDPPVLAFAEIDRHF